MKKILTLILLILLIFTGCSLVFPGVDESSDLDNTQIIDYTPEFKNKWCYQKLPPPLKSGYNDIYSAINENFSKDNTVSISDSKLGTQREYNGLRVELSKPLQNKDDAKLLYTALVWDNPQFFYIGNTYSYEGFRAGETDYYNVFCLVYTMTAQERQIATQQLENIISQIQSKIGLSQRSDQFETELLLHDELLSRCTYEEKANGTTDPAARYPSAFTAYGALVKGRAVCEGYSRAMQLLLNWSNIECTLVSGSDKDGVAHMWNMVTIDERNYHLDPTWNDSSDRTHHSYFNLTTAEILRSHIIDNSNIGIDTCTSLDANYYIRRGHYLDTLKRDDIAQVIARAVKEGETTIDLRFTEKAFAAAHLLINNRDLLTQKVNAYLIETGLSMWNYVEYNVNEIYNTLTIYKE